MEKLREPFADKEKTVYCQFDTMMPLSEIKKLLNPKNRNKHPKDQVERLAKIMDENGVRHPIVISTLSNIVTKGQGRAEAALYNSWTTFPVQYQDYESTDAEYQDCIADNAIASWAELDLSGINLDLTDIGPFDIKLLGLKDFEVEPADRLHEFGTRDEDNSRELVGIKQSILNFSEDEWKEYLSLIKQASQKLETISVTETVLKALRLILENDIR